MTLLYDPETRLVQPGQLRECDCGWLMAASRDGRHTLVYRCDPERCGNHTAHITDIEDDLAKAYLQWLASRSRYAPTRITPQLLAEAFDRLDTAWVLNGRIEAFQFRNGR